MKPLALLINPGTKRLRGGWRFTVFLALLMLPFLASSLLIRSAPDDSLSGVAADSATIMFYAMQLAWVLFASWLCLRLLEGLPLRSLGISPGRERVRDAIAGVAGGMMMILGVVVLQFFGGMKLAWSAEFPLREAAAALALFTVAGAYEEALFRGYPLQTLLRSLPPAVPVLLFAGFFGLAHLANPNHTKLATVNTALAGVWLGVAYLKTRNLWFPTGLHLAWNWTMGAVFGLPVSGLHIPSQSVFAVAETGPEWLTGGSYGPEGGAATTVVLVAATVIIWRWKNGTRNTRNEAEGTGSAV
ncbi:MAG: CPBP family intramembrane metalloprotease [Acidobacteria bacterium]|nr:CPBP family intramembrane metalloprotease [Acidobacteriota bacterium]MCW5971625.1 CPBP family intramembrane metalloprotease [Blastocatellales bacterium]